MNRLMVRVLVAIFTLTIGLVAATLWVVYRRPDAQPAEVETEKVRESKPLSQPLTFEDSHTMSTLTYHNYYSFDGEGVRYGCFANESASRAAEELRETSAGKRIIERTPKLNNKGDRVGERVVVEYPSGSDTEANIIWTEGSRLFRIIAPSLKCALEFEKSQVWAGKECRPVAQPNNSFNRSANSAALIENLDGFCVVCAPG